MIRQSDRKCNTYEDTIKNGLTNNKAPNIRHSVMHCDSVKVCIKLNAERIELNVVHIDRNAFVCFTEVSVPWTPDAWSIQLVGSMPCHTHHTGTVSGQLRCDFSSYMPEKSLPQCGHGGDLPCVWIL